MGENRLMKLSFYHFIKIRNSTGSTYKSKHLQQEFHWLVGIMKRHEKVMLLSLPSMSLTEQHKVLGVGLISLLKGRGAGMYVHENRAALSQPFLRNIS